MVSKHFQVYKSAKKKKEKFLMTSSRLKMMCLGLSIDALCAAAISKNTTVWQLLALCDEKRGIA